MLGDRTLETTERIETFFLDRAEEILPVVLVETLTPVYVVMLEGVTIEGLPEDGLCAVVGGGGPGLGDSEWAVTCE